VADTSSKKTRQNVNTFSVNRKNFMDIVVKNENLSKKDLRVFIHLMTHLDGNEYRKVSYKNIALDLGYDKSDVKESINNLYTEGIVDIGDSGSVEKGLIITF